MAAITIVLAGVAGGGGAVVTLQSLSAPRPAPRVATVDPGPAGDPDGGLTAAAPRAPAARMASAAPVPEPGVHVVLAADASIGLAPATKGPLPAYAIAIPVPQPIATGRDRDPAADGGRADPGGGGLVASTDASDGGAADAGI